MQTAILAIAVLSLVLSALSLGWQAATFVLEGGRVKAELRPGAIKPGVLVTIPRGSVTKTTVLELRTQGFQQFVVAVQVRNIGRMPVTVMSWSLATIPGEIAIQPMANSIGPSLPHRLEAGDTASWAIDREALMPILSATATALQIPLERIAVKGHVTLGTGRTVTAKGSA